jgi:hypothetical protein
LNQNLEPLPKNKKNQIYGKIIAILLILTGILFLFTSFFFEYKLSASLILIGLAIFIMNNEKEPENTINNIQLILIIILLTLVIWLLTIDVSFEIFFVLLIISILALKELLHKFLSPYLQKRMTLLFSVLLIPLIIIFLQKIINILTFYSS